MNELNGGSATGNGELIGADVVNYARWGVTEVKWNDHTLSWEIIAVSRGEARVRLVQSRARSRDFSREYERYVAANERVSDTPGLHHGYDDPAVDPADHVQRD